MLFLTDTLDVLQVPCGTASCQLRASPVKCYLYQHQPYWPAAQHSILPTAYNGEYFICTFALNMCCCCFQFSWPR